MHATALTPELFRARFERLVELIRTEWPEVDDAALRACEGDLVRAVELIATTTDHTKTKIRHDLGELAALASGNGASTASALEALLGQLEGRVQKAVGQVRGDLLPKAEDTVRDHLWASLGIAAAIGFVLGLLTSGSRR